MSTMNIDSIAKLVCISVYATFLGAQLTEALLMVPHWQSLSAEVFYAYYAEFGPTIGKFYTILTIIASLIPLVVAIRFQWKKVEGARYAMASAFCALLVIVAFYVYFKGANASFYEKALSEGELAQELIVWSYWHWGRVFLEGASLIFLMLTFGKKEGG